LVRLSTYVVAIMTRARKNPTPDKMASKGLTCPLDPLVIKGRVTAGAGNRFPIGAIVVVVVVGAAVVATGTYGSVTTGNRELGELAGWGGTRFGAVAGGDRVVTEVAGVVWATVGGGVGVVRRANDVGGVEVRGIVCGVEEADVSGVSRTAGVPTAAATSTSWPKMATGPAATAATSPTFIKARNGAATPTVLPAASHINGHSRGGTRGGSRGARVFSGICRSVASRREGTAGGSAERRLPRGRAGWGCPDPGGGPGWRR
jgi:hypothetical protein